MNTGTIWAFDLANPPFNMSDWGGENLRQDVRWKFGMPPVNNVNYGWNSSMLVAILA
jgi:type I restriction enzyme M protein